MKMNQPIEGGWGECAMFWLFWLGTLFFYTLYAPFPFLSISASNIPPPLFFFILCYF
jgi:hypothetical protein